MRRPTLPALGMLLAGCGAPEASLPPNESPSEDLDRDGHPGVGRGGADCDDAAPSVFPGAPERCDGRDNDCDGLVDDLDPDLTERPARWYALDLDGDGYGSAPVPSCQIPPQALSQGGDCDDQDPNTFPGADEVCDGVDNDCDGLVDDEDFPVQGTFSSWPDLDLDGYGGPGLPWTSCRLRPGFAPNAQDCDDLDARTYPGASDTLPDGLDQDCDGEEPPIWVVTIKGRDPFVLPNPNTEVQGLAMVFSLRGRGPHILVDSTLGHLSYADDQWLASDERTRRVEVLPLEPLPAQVWTSLRLQFDPFQDLATLTVDDQAPITIPWRYSEHLQLGGRDTGTWYLWQLALTDVTSAAVDAPLGLWPGPGTIATWHGVAASRPWIPLESDVWLYFDQDLWAASRLAPPPPRELRP